VRGRRRKLTIVCLLLSLVCVFKFELSFQRPPERVPASAEMLSVRVEAVSFVSSLISEVAPSSDQMEMVFQGPSELTVGYPDGSSILVPTSLWFEQVSTDEVGIYSSVKIKSESAAWTIVRDLEGSFTYNCCGDDSTITLKTSSGESYDLKKGERFIIEASLAQTAVTCIFDSPKFNCPFGTPTRVGLGPIAVRDSNLVAADFSGANLRHAVFVASDLRFARFVGADLTGALFRDVDLRGVDFTGARQSGLTISRSATEGSQGLSNSSGAPRFP
jgi:hypothetical protein